MLKALIILTSLGASLATFSALLGKMRTAQAALIAIAVLNAVLSIELTLMLAAEIMVANHAPRSL